MAAKFWANWSFTDSSSYLGFFIYALFVFSTFSIAGSEASIFFIYLISLWRFVRRKGLGYKHWLIWPVIVYMNLTVLSGYFNGYPGIDHLYSAQTNWRLLLPFVLAIAILEVDQQKLIRFLFVPLLLVSLYGILQYFTGVDWLRSPERRLTTLYYTAADGTQFFHGKGNFTHHLTYGGYLLLLFPLFFLFTTVKDLSTKWRWFYGLGSVVMLTGAVSSLGRSIWLGILMVFWILLFRISKILGIVSLIIGLGLGGWIFQQVLSGETKNWQIRDNAIVQRLTSAFDITANKDRLLMWDSGVQGIQDHPIWGIGYGNDKNVMDQYRIPLAEKNNHRFNNSASAGVHNIYLQTWLNYGVIGFLAYLGIVFGFLLTCILSLRRVESSSWEGAVFWGALAGVSGFMVAGVFENNFRDGEVQTAFLMLMGLVLHQVYRLRN
ncbi:MAG: O-antigen ligase family protein [Deltaproteobacteria bacterium]